MGGDHDGKTAFENTMTNNPFNEFPRGVYTWFLYSAGIFFGELVRHVFIDEHKSDFGEMCVHHLATIMLIFGSGYANQVGIGALISWMHIATDIPVALAKIVSSMKGTCMEYTTGVALCGFLLPSWFYFRCGCFPFIIYSIFTSPACSYPSHLSQYDIFL